MGIQITSASPATGGTGAPGIVIIEW